MLKFRQTLTLLRLDEKKYLKSLEKGIGETFREAAREWLRATALKVPVKTGHAKGSLQPLGSFLRVAVNIQPRPGEKDKTLLGNNQQRFKFQDDRTHPGSMRFVFEWETKVLHYIWNEKGLHGPWNSVMAGEQAFKTYFQPRMRNRYPKIFDFIKRQKIAK